MQNAVLPKGFLYPQSRHLPELSKSGNVECILSFFRQKQNQALGALFLTCYIKVRKYPSFGLNHHINQERPNLFLKYQEFKRSHIC